MILAEASPCLLGELKSANHAAAVRKAKDFARDGLRWYFILARTRIFGCLLRCPAPAISAKLFRQFFPERWPSGLRRTLGKRV